MPHIFYKRQTGTRLTASFPGQSGQADSRIVKSSWVLMGQEMTGWQWHQLDYYANHLHLTADRYNASTTSHNSLQVFLTPNQQCHSSGGNGRHFPSIFTQKIKFTEQTSKYKTIQTNMIS